LLNGLPRLIDLDLRLGPCLVNCGRSSLQGRLTARFLTLKQGHARFPQPLLIFRRTRFGLGNVGSRFSIAPSVRLRRSASTATRGLCTTAL
jgi:hypothetical protein